MNDNYQEHNAYNTTGPLVVAISSRALFNMDESHTVYEREGVDAFARYQIENEDNPLAPGEAFNLAKKLLDINTRYNNQKAVEIILLSRNSGDSGLRVFNSIKYHGLNIERAAFCGGRDPWRYVKAFNSQLFLSMNNDDVRNALAMGVAAATLIDNGSSSSTDDTELRFAFDGDAVLFGDESERIYQQQGLVDFTKNEQINANNNLSGGPFKPFLSALQQLQAQLPDGSCPIRTALITARAAPSHERVIRTLRNWNIRIDESLFLGGLNKAEFLHSYGADVFFDDQQANCESASEYVASGHVPHGVTNETLTNKESTELKHKAIRSKNNRYAHWLD